MMSVADAEFDGPGLVKKSVAARERAILMVLAAVQFTTIVDFMLIMPLGPQLMRTLAISPMRFGFVVSSYTLSAGVTGLLASSLVDRFDRKTAFLWLYVGFLIGTLFCGLAPTYATLLVARVVTGAFGGVLGGMAMAIVGDVFPEERRGRATGSLMSAFALASVLGVPFGLTLGTLYGWHTPFLLLVGVGLAVLAAGFKALPRLRAHLETAPLHGPWETMVETYTHPNHLRAFALISTLMISGFAVVPYISPYMVANVGLTEIELPWIYVAGGALTLVGAPVVGRLADRYGKFPVYRVIAPMTAVLMLVVTNLPRVGLLAAVAVVGVFMVTNAGRMVAAMAMITGSVEPRLRGGFMSANSAVQHIAAGLGSMVAGLIVTKDADGSLLHFPAVGLIGVAATAASLWFASRLLTAKEALADPVRADPDEVAGAIAAIEPA
ncbi:MFS transporter [Tundrisphaera sp. TA3]|uniref:MFS transporter n=1 Tax=Tundrisphaera sp. TA3 TaxID=3435775 RepID=UPI003EB8CBED